MRQGRVTKSIAIFILMLSVPSVILFGSHSRDPSFFSLIHFGQSFASGQLAGVRELGVPIFSKYGYDGQFYAQLSLDPLLLTEDLNSALDNPSYRARRIGLPALAAVFGLGQVELTLRIYVFLNFVFWVLLAWVLLRVYSPNSWRDFALLVSILWTSGSLISLSRALTDFPAASLGLVLVLLRCCKPVTGWLFGFTALCKETAMLSFGAYISRCGFAREKFNPWIILPLIVPIVFWTIYSWFMLSDLSSTGLGNFEWPGLGFSDKIIKSLSDIYSMTLHSSNLRIATLILEVFAPISLFIQCAYMLLRWRLTDPIWCFGAGFVALFLVLGPSVWEAQFAYTRALLPLTMSFNLLLHAHASDRGFWVCFFMGNIGLTGVLGLTFWQLIFDFGETP
jgi:hypothetical protein